MTENELKKLNPQIREIEIGISNLRKIKIFPLSVGDELKLSEIIGEALKSFSSREDQSELAFASFVIDLISENFKKILGLILGPDENNEKVMSDFTNTQVLELIHLIYEVNFESSLKNAKSLFGKIKPLFLSERRSPRSANDTGIKSEKSSPATEKEG
uniref:Tail assembly chaperone n=1 Tax=viral metagenome TaxID=1070528 RepID=A0A6M3J8C5_9ZZZZ